MTRVAVVFTGGTISMRPDRHAGGAVPVLSGEQIIARTPGLARVAELEPIDWGLVPASHLDLARLVELGRVLEAALARQEIAGAVLVQGTDTIEESAFAFDLLLDSDKPVIVTGAMRNSAEADYDGARNLTDAVSCAASGQLRGMGCLVVLDGRIIAADEAVKMHTTALDAFQPRHGILIGEVDDGRIRLHARRGVRRVLPRWPSAPLPAVHLLTVVTGMDGTLLRLLAQARPAGLVVAATGAGNTHPDVLLAAEELMSQGVAVCLTSRCWSGSVAPAYGFPGGGAQWQRAGALLCPLSGPKARIALGLAIGAGLGDAELRSLMQGSAG